ncbi:hypothetical protein D4R52_02905 [bacterium]|nr:MAG: hypothetical protein D4R52_02905 [bacterium]
MEESIEKLEKEISAIKERNVRVEADKAWETSGYRILFITGIIYVVAALVLYFAGVKNYLLNALVPAAGYFLSMQSLPAIKKRWIKKFLSKKES